jgi:hypothetical protein
LAGPFRLGSAWFAEELHKTVAFVGPAVFVPESNATLLERVHELSGLTWEQIARMFNVSRRSVHMWLSGCRMSAANREALVALDLTVRSLPGRTAEDRRRQLLFESTATGRSVYNEARYQRASSDHDINKPFEPAVVSESVT